MQREQKTVCALLDQFAPQLSTVRNELHETPELGMQEYETTKILRRILEEMGIEILPSGLETGLIGLVRGRSGGKTVALRADIDALPVTEVPWGGVCSKRPGMMHACGHDAHMAGLLGAAYVLQQMRDCFDGNVLLVFQPGEEPCEGAKKVIETGILQKYGTAAMFGAHVYPCMPEGTVAIREGFTMCALTNFCIRVQGRGAHAAMPHLANDPVVAGAAVITALQTIASRRMVATSPIILSVCCVQAGTAINVIPDAMEIKGSIRFADESMRETIKRWVEKIAQDTADAHGCTAEVSYLLQVPAVRNAPALTAIATAAAEKAVGRENVKAEEMWLGSEDFSYYGAIVPSWFFFSGCATPDMNAALHSPLFHASEQTVLNTAKLLANAALETLEREV